MKSKNFLQYPSNTPKYTTSVTYWMLNNILFNIPFWMHNNLNIIVKIFNTIYLQRLVLLTSIPPEGIPTFLLFTIGITSLGSKTIEKYPLDGRKKGQIPIPVTQQLLYFLERFLIFFKL